MDKKIKSGIFSDLSKKFVDRRKKALSKFFAAKKAGKSAYFSIPEPDKPFIDGRLCSAPCKLTCMVTKPCSYSLTYAFE